MNDTQNPDQRAHRRRVVTGAVVTGGGLAILGIAAAVIWSWRTQLPDPVATHWGVDNTPDGFSSLGTLLALLFGLGGGFVLLFGATTWALGRSSVTRRIGTAITVWLALFLSIVIVGSLHIQRGLADARDAGSLGGVLLAAFLGSFVSAVLAAVVVPGDPPAPTTEAVPADAPRAVLVDGDRTTWTGRVSSVVPLAIGVPVVVLTLVLAVVTRLWAVLIVDAVVIGALATLSAFVVRVDRSGLTVRSSVGWPRYRVPLDEVIRADVTQVSPVRDFGGWGWRVGRGGQVGVVLRRGEAVAIQRTAGRSIVVTVDGATTGAGVLNALADRARSG